MGHLPYQPDNCMSKTPSTPFQFAQGATVATSKTENDEIHVVPRVDIDASKPWRCWKMLNHLLGCPGTKVIGSVGYNPNKKPIYK